MIKRLRLASIVGGFAIFSLLILTSSSAVQAQSLGRVVIGAAGGFHDNGEYSLAYTVGELSSSTLSNGQYFLTQGFQQSDDLVLYVPDDPIETTSTIQMSVYPNPFRNRLTIQATDVEEPIIDIYVVDMLGNVVNYRSNVSATELVGGFEIPTDAWTSGIYFVRVVSANGAIKQDLKIVKNK